MIRYELQRPLKQNIPGFVMIGSDFKTVKPSELQKHLDDGWFVIRKRYFFITSFLDRWKKLSDGNKIAVIAGIVVPISIAIFLNDTINVNIAHPSKSYSNKSVFDSLANDSNDTITRKESDSKLEPLAKESDSVQAADTVSNKINTIK